MNRITAIVGSAALAGAIGCTEGPVVSEQTSSAVREDSGDLHELAEAVETLESCPRPIAPLERPRIQPRNRITSTGRVRREIERVEVLDLGTNRVLFALDEQTLEALRQLPAERRTPWRGPNMRPDSLPAWHVALLVHAAGEELPYLGHVFDDGHVYFVDEDDPWDPTVYDADMNLRGVYGIDTDLAVDVFLTARLGEHDPFGNLFRAKQRADSARCGGASPASDEPVEDLVSQARRTPELCPDLFRPSLVPLEAPKITPRNRAQVLQPIRGRIDRVEVVELSTHRVLFSFDDATVAALRRTPEDAEISWRSNERPASLPAWDVGVLIHVAGKELPYLGHYFDDSELYFVDESDPWDPAVFDRNGKMRDVYGVPVDYAVDGFLIKRLGEYDPFGKLANKAQRAQDQRCGRVSQRTGDPFPQLPKAIVEPAEQ